MRMNEPMFTTEQHELYLGEVFVEYIGPELFTCYDQDKTIYLGVSSGLFEERTVKRMIQQLRLDGYPIISHPDGGYFIPYRYSSQDMWLANKFVGTMKAQAYSRIKVADALVDSIASLELGQVSFDD